jgi:DNA-binding PadR family transcriptional regulator
MELTGWLRAGIDPLAELEKLCGHRWESHALLQLAAAAGPLRRAELAAAIRRQCGGRPDDTQLGRTMRRLTADRLVHSTATADGHRQYTLTARGRQRVERLEALIRIMLHWHEAPDLPDHQS